MSEPTSQPASDDANEATSDPASEPASEPAPSMPRRGRVVAAGGCALVLVIVAVVVAGRSPAPPPQAAAAPPTVAPIGTTTTEPATTTTEPAPDPGDGTTTTTRKPRRPPTGPPGPLTGAPVDYPGIEARPALVVKIDNLDPWARPQAGLTLADVVYEEKVEGPYSRFAAVFHGSDSDVVGPVRSARSTDVAIVGPLNQPLFAYSGANGGFQALLSITPLIDVGAAMRGGVYWRGGDKPVPHNLYSGTRALLAGVPGRPPRPLWDFRGADEPPGMGATPTSSVTYHFGGQMTLVTWTWDPAQRAWFRTQNGSTHFDLDNWPVSAANVVIQYVPYEASIAQDMFGNAIPEAALGGQGRGWVLTGGAAIPATWTRYALESPTVFTGPDDQAIRFAPGRTWVILVPVQFPATIRFTNGGAAS